MEELEEDFKILIDAWIETDRTETEVLAKSAVYHSGEVDKMIY